MIPERYPAIRAAVAMRLRQAADRMEPPRRRSIAPLVRLGGVWWQRREAGVWEELEGQASQARAGRDIW
jgi:hypothetical protein